MQLILIILDSTLLKLLLIWCRMHPHGPVKTQTLHQLPLLHFVPYDYDANTVHLNHLHHTRCYSGEFQLTLYQTNPDFNDPDEEAFLKHCGKR